MVSVATLIAAWNDLGSAIPRYRLTSSTPAGQSSVPVKSGFAGNEVFCASRPLSGTLSYRVNSGLATLRVAIRHLPRSSLVGVNWSNNRIRGYLIGTVRSDERGDSASGSARLVRPAESRGYSVVLTAPRNKQVLATMWPCGSPAAATMQCEQAIQSRLPLTAASVESCLSGQLIVRHLCPPSSSTLFVIWRGRTYTLSERKAPVELPQQYGMGAITQACGPIVALTVKRVTVSPSANLHDGQQVRVSVQGFRPDVPGIKFFLSECESPLQVNPLGCGRQLAAQPFGLTDSDGDGSGSVSFTVQSSAAPKALSSVVVPCAGTCVIVATTGTIGQYGFAPIAFAG